MVFGVASGDLIRSLQKEDSVMTCVNLQILFYLTRGRPDDTVRRTILLLTRQIKLVLEKSLAPRPLPINDPTLLIPSSRMTPRLTHYPLVFITPLCPLVLYPPFYIYNSRCWEYLHQFSIHDVWSIVRQKENF